MRFSLRASCLLLLGCTARPAASISAAETWPWSRRAPKAPPAPEPAGAGAEAAALAADKQAVVKSPTRPGCWMRMPSGCPKNPMDTQKWRHDAWAEQKGLDEAGCQGRAGTWNGFCDAQDAVMAFVPAKQDVQDSQDSQVSQDANTTQAQDSQDSQVSQDANTAQAQDSQDSQGKQ